MNSFSLSLELMNRGIPLTKDGRDLVRTIAYGDAADRWIEKNRNITPVAVTRTKIEGISKLKVLYYK